MIDHLKELKKAGRPVIGCFPLYPPLALFHSLDLMPAVLWGFRGDFDQTPQSDRHLQNYTCSVARHMTEFLFSEAGGLVDGLFMYNACDTLRNLPEIIQRNLNQAGRRVPFFHIHVPMTPPHQTDAGEYLENEINGLIADLENEFGRNFSTDAFKKSIDHLEKRRGITLDAEDAVAQGRLDFQFFAKTLHLAWAAPGMHQPDRLAGWLGKQALNEANSDKPGIIVSGILPPPDSLISAIEASGLRIAGNDIASLHRTYAAMPAAATDPAAYYRDFYTNHYPCPTLLYTGDRRLSALLERCRKTGAAGVVFVGEKFCEYEYFEFPYLEKKLREQGIQTLMIEAAIGDDAQTAQQTARIEAFAEMLNND
ncbi:MAG: 2-hydroxyacyl-CoA dehydratase family protein [Desulfobacterales bacterium]|nr:2-hydroxyacyl-CoA dehydratase family protein [Desulfobacterales bacterium]